MIDELKHFGTAGVFNPAPVNFQSLKYGRAHVHRYENAGARLMS